VLIRTATTEDWPQVYRVFTEVTSEGTSYTYPSGLSSEEARELWTSRRHVVVAVEDDQAGPLAGTVLGTAVGQPNQVGRGSHVATASFMVAGDARGRGVGRALGEHLLGWATAEGFRAMQFNAVVETNTAAVALWHSLGFTLVGTVPEAFDHPEHGLVGLHVMHRFLP